MKNPVAVAIKKELQTLANPTKAQFLQGFFKTAPGQYAAGDTLLGISVPAQRAIAKTYFRGATLDTLTELLHSPEHEYRLTSLIIAVEQFKKADDTQRKKLFSWYLTHRQWVNNWDLVDVSSRFLVGQYLIDYPAERKILNTLVVSPVLWDRRIAIVATHAFIMIGQFDLTIDIATKLMADKEDLIHKAVGWMLREMGKKDLKTLTTFLDKYAAVMPRTMLRYSLEKLDQSSKERYMKKKSESERKSKIVITQ